MSNSNNHHTYSTSAYFLSQFASVHQNLHLFSNSNSNNNTNNLTGKATVDSQIRQVKTFMAQRIYNSNGKPTFSFAKKYKSPTASVNDLLSAGKDICMSGTSYGIQCVEGFLLSLYNCHRLGVMYTPHLRPNMLAVQWNPLAELLMSNTTESSTEKSFVSALEMTNLVTNTSQAQQPCVTALFPLRFVAKDSTRIHSHIVLGVMFLFPEDVSESNNSKQNNTNNNNRPSPPSSSSPSNTRCQTAAMRRNMIQTSGIQAKNANHNDNNNNSENESATSSVSTDNKLPPRFVGTIGISRVSELGTSPHLRRSLGEVCRDFIENYAKWGNEVLEIIVGGPIPLPHLCDKQSGQSRRVNWKLANAVRALFVPDNSIINSKSSPEKAAKQTKNNNNNSNSTSNSSNDYDDDGDDDDDGTGNKITSPTSGSVVDDDDEVKVLLSSCPGRVVLTETPIFESSLSMMEDIVVRAAFRNQQTLVGTLSPAQLRITGFGNCSGGVNANISKEDSSEKSLFGYVAPQPVVRESGNTSNNNSPQKGGCRKNDLKEESPVSSKQKKEIDETKKKQEIKEKQDGGSILDRSASAAVIRARAMELTSSIEKNNNSSHRDREASSKAKTAGEESPSKKKKCVPKEVEKNKIEDDDHEREIEHGSDDNSPLLLQKLSKRRPGSSKAAKPIATASSPTTIRNKQSVVPIDNKNKITKTTSLPPTTPEKKNIAPVPALPPKLARTASAGLLRPSSRSTSCEVVSPKKKNIKDEKDEEKEPQAKPQSTRVNDKTKKTRPASSSFSYHRSSTPDLDSLLKDDATGSPQRKNKVDEGNVVSNNNNLPSIVTITIESGNTSKNRDQRNPNFQNNYNNNNNNNNNNNSNLIINGSARHYEFKMTSSSSPLLSNATTDRSYNHHISLEEILSAGTSASSNHSKNNNSAPCSASSNNELGTSSCSTSSTFSLSPSFGCSLRRNNNDNSVVPVTSSSTFSSASSGRGNNEEGRMYSSSSSFSNSSTSMAAALSKVWGQEQIQKSQQQREFKSIQKREEEEREAERRGLLLGTVVSSPPRNSQKNNVEDSSQRRLHGRFTSCYPPQQKSEQQYHEESSYCLYDLMNSNNDNNNNHGSQQQQHYNSYPRGSISKGNKNPSSVLDFQYEDL